MANTPATPDVVNPSAVPPATKSVLLDLMVVLAFFPVIAKFLGAHDLLGLVGALQSSDGLAFLAIVVPIAASAWRARLRVLRWAKAVRWARSADNEVAVVKEPSPPPAAA